MHLPEYLRNLNPEQRRAATITEGPLLVIAGAGSGKTRTLVHRIVHLIRGSGVEPRRILAVTFTNRAAAEMRERVRTMAGRDARGVTLCTFHSLGARILRAHGEPAGLPKNFTIYNAGDQASLVKRLLAEEVRVAPTVGSDAFDARRVHARISGWKNRLATPEEARREVADEATSGTRADDYAVAAADAYPRYEASLRAAGACDFDDLLLLPVRLLQEHPEIRDALWRRWQYLMVDEYQDTNGAQLELARLLSGPTKNLCVVGDDDQSIYAWRGADLRNILQFERHFREARTVVLEENYRSTQSILDAANAVIARNTARKPKRMRTANGPGPRIDYWEFRGGADSTAEQQEAEMVAREIGVRRFHEQRRWGDFGVLYRVNHQARPLEEALRTANIPYRVVGGTSYFDRKEIADAAAYLRVIVNPHDDLSFRRILNYPSRGIGRTTQFRVLEAAGRAGVSLREMLGRLKEIDGLTPRQREAASQFTRGLEQAKLDHDRAARQALEGKGEAGALAAWATEFFASLGLEAAIRAENRSDRAAQARIDNLRDFTAAISDYEQRTRLEAPLPDEEAEWQPPSLAGFLERLSLFDGGGDDRPSDDDAPDQVTLMTLHSAKGLEFTHVFMIGLEEEILPHARALEDPEGGVDEDPVAEERRLFYVGLTRARHRLTLSGCATRSRRGEELPRQPSRFLKDIPAELLEMRSGDLRSTLTEDDRQEMKQNFFTQMKDMLG